jgi:adenylylsulfate kinase-like enzyme
MKRIKKGVIWITGLSASGKSTLSTGLYLSLKSLGFQNIILLDGDELRKHSSRKYGYTVEERTAGTLEDIETVSKYCDDGYFVIIATISPQKKVRLKARYRFQNFYEVYLKCSVSACTKRDFKGQYAQALSGNLDNFVGVDLEYQLSDSPDIVVNTEANKVDYCSKLIFDFVSEKFEI